jgi:hypothetical protein
VRQLDNKKRPRGQAMTETVLMFPIFMFFMFAFAKLFALMILVQKVEIAGYYAARRWQLESHRNVAYDGFDSGVLQHDIENKAKAYVGYGSPTASFLDLSQSCPSGGKVGLAVERTQVWNVLTFTVCTKPIDIAWMYHSPGFKLEVTKYVPNRDRPIGFVLPGLQP